MITKIVGEQPFQVLTNNFSISPSSEGYTLQISADGVNYSNLFTVGAGVTRLVTGVAANSYYKLSGNQSQVSINWMKMCVTEGQGGGNAGELEPVTAFPVGAPEGTVVALASGDTVGVYQYDGENWNPVGNGGGGSVVELTQQEYNALANPDSGTTYIITDAPVVDLNDYAMASGLTELSSSTATALATKADKQNVTARASNSNYLPGWNSQGVITGSTAYYNKSQGINGQNYNVFSSSNTNHPAIFAPTSAGTAGQPLLSNGSGGPVWGTYKFAFITQTAYDALTTKDATTIYFITGD